MRQVNKEMLEAAYQLLSSHQRRSVSVRTHLRYMQTGKAFFGRHREIFETTSSRTYYLRKAALSFFAAFKLEEAIKNFDPKKFRLAFLTLEKLSTPLVGHAAVSAGRTCPIKRKGNRKSKNASLKNLPDDWREQMLDGVTGRHRDWLLLLSVAGVRPEEIARGVDVIPRHDGIALLIRGAKTSNGFGQPERVIFSVGDWETELAIGGARTIYAVNANAVSRYVIDRGAAVFSMTRNPVSAYSYRHQFCSDLKGSDVPSLEAAALMGHSVEYMKKFYGRKVWSRRRLDVELLRATNAVKPIVTRQIQSTRRLDACQDQAW